MKTLTTELYWLVMTVLLTSVIFSALHREPDERAWPLAGRVESPARHPPQGALGGTADASACQRGGKPRGICPAGLDAPVGGNEHGSHRQCQHAVFLCSTRARVPIHLRGSFIADGGLCHRFWLPADTGPDAAAGYLSEV